MEVAESISCLSVPSFLIGEWVASCERPVAWLSLDEADNNLTRFPVYLVAALQALAKNGAEGITANIGIGALARALG